MGGVLKGSIDVLQVAQVAAYTLGCDLSRIRIRPSNTHVGANSNVTGGSVGSDVNSYVTFVDTSWAFWQLVFKELYHVLYNLQ